MSEALAFARASDMQSDSAEADRLAALDTLDILDTPPEQGFDTIVALAKRIFGVNIAIVSAIDAHRQWYKSCVGLDAAELERKVTFCDFTIRQQEPLIVPDTSIDPRFAANPFVTGPAHIAFYAGVPLTTRAGYNIGTLCIAHDEPRIFSEADRETLVDLARLTMEMMELRQSASVDAMTGLMSRAGFRREAERTFALALRHGAPLACLMVDVDHFKSVNDNHGHAAGDIVFAGVGQACLEGLRHSDLMGRIGGEEFAVLLPHTDATGAREVGEKIRKAVQRRRFELGNVTVAVTVSVGVSMISVADGDFDAMLARADGALYKAKQAGRNCVVEEPSPERRDSRRRVLKAGQIVFRNGLAAIDCTVRSLGEMGAGLDVVSSLGIPDNFRLTIRADRFENPCRVISRAERHLEVRFE